MRLQHRRPGLSLTEVLHRSGLLTDRHYAAAYRWEALWNRAGLAQRVSARYGEPPGHDLSETPDARTAEDDYHDVMKSMPERHQSILRNLLDVSERSVRLSSGINTRAALDWLADFWGLAGD